VRGFWGFIKVYAGDSIRDFLGLCEALGPSTRVILIGVVVSVL
jgi:hypothetical protein